MTYNQVENQLSLAKYCLTRFDSTEALQEELLQIKAKAREALRHLNSVRSPDSVEAARYYLRSI